MIELNWEFEDGSGDRRSFDLPLLIGRTADCALQLKSWRVAREHARLVDRAGTLFVEDLGSLGGTFLNGKRITEYGPLSPGDEIIIGPCRLRLMRLSRPVMRHFSVPNIRTAAGSVACVSQREPKKPENFIADVSALATSVSSPVAAASSTAEHLASQAPTKDDTHYLHHRRRLHKALLDALDLRRRDILSLSDEALRQQAMDVLRGLVQSDDQLPPDIDRSEILQEVVDEAVGLGPLEPLLADASVTEIMVNSHENIYVERGGRLEKYGRRFSSEQAVEAVIDRIVAPIGRRVDEASPMVDARLRDGSRVNAVIHPIALRGACLTIRKFPERRLDMNDLLSVDSLDEHMANFLRLCVQTRKSLLVSGGTGSGKTTLLNVLSNCIPESERIITIEDAAELRLNHQHLVSLESRPANAEGKGKIEIRDLVRNALRMRPDRVIVGECRGAEAFDMLAAMNTGHEGSLTTLHANSPRDALARLETMILMAGMDLPLSAIREHIASAVRIIVQQARLANGWRLITSIVEVTGMEGGRIQTQELFRYRNDDEPRFEGCGVLPECFDRGNEAVPLDWLTQITMLRKRGAISWQS